ncbi:hypothetical protein TWF694_006085 [Orbilia ellipsospora]|uniref:Secreted protein n=1 Tax=Orbilia ellipsospora TaxID=2528407 RepID=A0AAV9WR94_9PEZI
MKNKLFLIFLGTLTSIPWFQAEAADRSPQTSHEYVNSFGDYNAALGYRPPNHQGNPRGSQIPREGKKKGKENLNGMLRRDPVDPDTPVDPNDPQNARWLKPPPDNVPHMDYNCQRQAETAYGLQPFEILDLSRYLIWQLVNNTMTFVSRPSNPHLPCVANWDGGFRPCRDPGSATTDPLVESFKAWAKWTADDWEIRVSKVPDDAGCDEWRGPPEWLTTGGGQIPPYVPQDFYAGIPTLWQ